jgi:hypothetical protein
VVHLNEGSRVQTQEPTRGYIPPSTPLVGLKLDQTSKGSRRPQPGPKGPCRDRMREDGGPGPIGPVASPINATSGLRSSANFELKGFGKLELRFTDQVCSRTLEAWPSLH